MIDCVYFAAKHTRLAGHFPETSRLGDRQKELDNLYLRMVDALDGYDNGSYSA